MCAALLQLVVEEVWFCATVARHANLWSGKMTQNGALGVQWGGNCAMLKTFAIGPFHMGQQEQRVVSLQVLNESTQTADPPKRHYLRVGSRINVFGLR